MNFTQLEYLKALVHHGSFSLAAEKLKITQPALSLQIAKLEEKLDFKLLDRRKRPIQLTPEGETFYEKTIEILKLMNELKQVSFEMGEEVKGYLKVGIIPTLAPYLVSLFTDNLNADYPNLQLEVSEQKTEEIIRQIKMGTLDCGILSTPVFAVGVKFERLFFEKFYAYVSEKHPQFKKRELNMTDIPEEDIWYLEEGNCFQNQVNSICQVNLQKAKSQSLIYRSNSIESLRRIVENKHGITFIPELATINIPSEQEELVKKLAGPTPVREISLVTTRNNPKERQISVVKNAIIQSVPKRMRQKPEGAIIDTNIRI
ncbi:LysR family transcriptional regulator, hydrogen peroxide-inducible genes activator [Mariniphaga anaerophila]|uniref:LysR family transcriptional regulator, hydrogen peroxide-inducible genes activator n=1 Tax=Mariniphaga anaerophila TaxID=1484053 RepID=A0A1M4W499_9BACT|nr:hydrogen peroxide-inducible genes activator [Mariniphaga anaerophila]SHE75772.1 LysR family transcriptional regulator, hydrogen peroxide-inducible genes activator [Mariniphaga anaerophila]